MCLADADSAGEATLSAEEFERAPPHHGHARSQRQVSGARRRRE